MSAALLFLLSGHPADAAEAASDLDSRAEDPAADALVEAIRRLASCDGRELAGLVSTSPPPPDPTSELEVAATHRLWVLLWHAVRQIAAKALGESRGDDTDYVGAVLDATAPKERLELLPEVSVETAFYAPGVRHLALLIRGAAEALSEASVAELLPPDGVGAAVWSQFAMGYARQRPFLWRNHREVLSAAFLTPGHSAVLTLPTGTGKSTLTELRIGAERLRGRSVVFLAPTRALVGQVRRSLSDLLEPTGLGHVRGFLDDDVSRGLLAETADVAVMTPEACLLSLGMDVGALADTGLIVFDECHLLAGASERNSQGRFVPGRRSVSANLALLELVRRAPGADIVLLSAMVSNGEALAGWVESLTGRPCENLINPWKPTRQVRGILAYDREELESLQATLVRERARFPRGKKPPTRVQKTAAAAPLAVFCHRQMWDEGATYSAMPLLDRKVPLALNSRWQLTPNRNKVAAALGAALSNAGIKPLIFCQTTRDSESAAQVLAEGIGAEISDTPLEVDAALAPAATELGGSEHLLTGRGGRVGFHHGLLLVWEREAVEAAFKAGELDALTATATLAQGMNLPAQAVILAGDDRWNPDEEEREDLSVHEVLNAAGRAGRAGMFAQGIVIVISGKNVVGLESAEGSLELTDEDHDRAMALLGSSDQCLEVTDPLTQIMDLVLDAAGHSTDSERFLLRTLSGFSDVDRQRRSFVLGQSFGAHVAASRGDLAIFEARVASFSELAEAQTEADESPLSELAEVGQLLGVAPSVLGVVASELGDRDDSSDRAVGEWVDWIGRYLDDHPDHLDSLLRLPASGLHLIFPLLKVPGPPRNSYEEPAERDLRIARSLGELLEAWTEGLPLYQLDGLLFMASERKQQQKSARLARRFYNQTAPALAGLGLLVQRVWQCKHSDAGSSTPAMPLAVEALPRCLKLGFDDPAKLALADEISGALPASRVAVHQKFETLRSSPELAQEFSDMASVRTAVRDALRRSRSS